MKKSFLFLSSCILFTALGFSQQQVLTKTGKLTTLTKVDVGLGNVDNTSDANKPISTATQIALNAKAGLGGDLAGTGTTAAAPIITAGAVTSEKIADGTILNTDLATGAGGIYKGSGDLSGSTVVTQGANSLSFTTTGGTTFNINGISNAVGIGTASPNSKLQVAGSFSLPIQSTATALTLDSTHATILVDATSGDVTITLPAASTVNGRIYTVIKADSTSNKLIFSTTINGSGFTFTQANLPGEYRLQSDGANWFLIN